MVLGIALIILLCLVIESQIGDEIREAITKIQAFDWVSFGIKAGIVIFVLFVVFLILHGIYKNVKKKRKQKEHAEYLDKKRKEFVDKIVFSSFKGTSDYIKKQLEETKKNVKTFVYGIKEEDKPRLEEWYGAMERNIAQVKNEENNRKEKELENERRIIWEKEEKVKEFRRQVEECFQVKKKEKSIKALPLDKEYPPNVVRSAEHQAEIYFAEREHKKQLREDTIEFYRSHSLNVRPPYDNKKDREICDKVRREIKSGKIKIQKKVVYEPTKPLPKNIFRANELDESEKLHAKAQGFRYVKIPNLDGFLRGGFYIKKENPRETDYHFVTKHLFAELHDNIYIEETINGRRVDAVFLLKDIKLGIEVETGANRESYLAAKVNWLNESFDQWLFVCPEKYKIKYQKYLGSKGICLSPKKAKEFVEEVLLNAGEPINDR